MSRSQRPAAIAALALAAAACGPQGAAPEPLGTQLSGLCSGAGAVNASFDLRDAQGRPVDLSAENTSITVHTRKQGGAWQPAKNVVLDFDGPSQVDLVLVADNSGSEKESLARMKEAARTFAASMLEASTASGRVALVRVSTSPAVLQELTSDPARLEAAIDQLFVSNGWTALYDGLRMANDVLAQAAPATCTPDQYRAVVAFTDGRENRSQATTLQDLLSLSAGGARTPLHFVGIGAQTDAETLSGLAAETGGHYRHVDSFDELLAELRAMAQGAASTVPITFEVADCEQSQVRVTASVKLEQASFTLTLEQELPPTCGR